MLPSVQLIVMPTSARTHFFAALLFLAAACAQPPVSDDVTIEFHDDDADATIVARQTFRLKSAEADRARISDARNAAILGTDPWSVRFDRMQPARERVTFDRAGGELERASHSAVVPAEDVERFFSDVSLTVKYTRGDGWGELAIYPGTSNRATREQQRHFDAELESWAKAVARYYTALDHMYAYMNENPQRARYLFAALLGERGVDGAPPLVTEEEQPYVDTVAAAMDAIGAKLDEQEPHSWLLAEEADLVHNPFPARLTVIVPGSITARQGFTAGADGKSVVVEPIDLYERIKSLEGRWVSPDPLLLLLRDANPTAESLALLYRRSAPSTTAREIEDAVRAGLARPQTYLVRWRP